MIDHAILACLHGRHVDGGLADLNALGFEAVVGFLEQVRSVQQGLGRNAADVQAGTAEARLALRVGIGVGFGAGGAEAELRSADRRHITAGAATTDDQNIKLLRHIIFSLG